MHILYISDNDYYLGTNGGVYGTAALPLEFLSDALPMLKGLCFWGRLRSKGNVANMIRMDNVLESRGIPIEFDGPREQPPGPLHYARGIAGTFPSLRRRLAEADVLWAKMPSIFAELAWRFGKKIPFRVSQQVGDAGQSVARMYPRLKLLGKHQDRMSRRMSAEADLSTFVSRSLLEAFGSDAAQPMVFHQVAVTRQMLRSDRRGPHDPLRLLYVGRLSPEKGLPHLVQALPDCPDVCLEVIGDGPLLESCRRAAAGNGSGERITWAGRLGWGEPVFARMREADALVLPSLTEGLPQVVVEAMCMGLPVIATSVGGVPEIVNPGENGLLVPPADPDAIARAVSELRRPGVWQKLAVGAAATAKANTVEAQWGPALERIRSWWESTHSEQNEQEVLCGRA